MEASCPVPVTVQLSVRLGEHLPPTTTTAAAASTAAAPTATAASASAAASAAASLHQLKPRVQSDTKPLVTASQTPGTWTARCNTTGSTQEGGTVQQIGG